MSEKKWTIGVIIFGWICTVSGLLSFVGISIATGLMIALHFSGANVVREAFGSWFAFVAAIALSISMILFLLFAGRGLLKFKEWARRWVVYFSYLAIVSYLLYYSFVIKTVNIALISEIIISSLIIYFFTRPKVKEKFTADKNHSVLLAIWFTVFALSSLSSIIMSKQATIMSKQAVTSEAGSIIIKMANKYAALKSYQSSGVVEEGETTPGKKILDFKWYFKRPNLIRFEWVEPRMFSLIDNDEYIVWSDGKQTYFCSYGGHYTKCEKEKDVSMGIAGATGISRGSAHTVYSLLAEKTSILTYLKELQLIGEEEFEDVQCYHISGRESFTSFKYELWIGKEDYLLRKIIMVTGLHKTAEIHRDIKMDADIPSEVFNLTPNDNLRWAERPKYDGLIKTYYSNGTLRTETNYVNGIKEGIARTYYENGTLASETNYKNDRCEGIIKMYYENGALKSEGHCKDGCYDGVSKSYYEDGALMTEFDWENGMVKSTKSYDKNGKLREGYFHQPSKWTPLKK